MNSDTQTEIKKHDSDQQAAQNVLPTLIIGLGGTGKEVIMRVRQNFYERYKVVGYPIVKYLWIDTQPNFAGTYDEGGQKDFIQQQIRLRPKECIEATIDPSQVMDYYNNQKMYPHIFEWLSPNLKAYGTKGVIDGAYQIRPLGKLAFYHHFEKIEARMREICQELNSIDVRNKMEADFEQTVGSQNRINVYIVCSLAGGTGSGMFLDMGFLANNAIAEYGPRISGFLVLPNVFTARGDKEFAPAQYGNAYAALKELNYYYSSKPVSRKVISADGPGGIAETRHDDEFHEYRPDWKGNGDKEPVMGPPFHNCFLIGNRNNSNQVIMPDNKSEIFSMISEKIFLDFEKTQFAEKMRGFWENTHSSTMYDYPYEIKDTDENNREQILFKSTFPCRYASLGMAKIHVNIDRLRNAAAYYLAEEIANIWLRPHSRDGQLDKQIIELRDELHLDRKDIEKAISRTDSAGTVIAQLIDSEFEKQRINFHNRITGKKVNFAGALDAIHKEFTGKLDKTGEDPAKWGSLIKVVEIANKEKYMDLALKRLQNKRSEMLDNMYVGFDTSERMFQGIADQLEKFNKDFQRSKEREDRNVEIFNKRYTKYRNRVLEIQRSWTNNIIYHRDVTLKLLIDRALDNLKNLHIHKAKAHVYNICADICKLLVLEIGTRHETTDSEGETVTKRSGLIQDNWQIREKIKKLQEELHKKFKSFQDYPPETRNVRLAKTLDFNQELTKEHKDEKGYREWLSDLSNKFLHDCGAGSVSNLLEHLADADTFENKLVTFSFNNLGDVAKDIDALKAFTAMYPETAKRKMKIGATVSMSDAWLLGEKSQSAIWNSTDIRMITQRAVGVKRSDKDAYRNFTEELKSLGKDIQVLSNYNDAIVFYTEVAGFPLFYINGLNKWRAIYLDEMSSRSDERHLERDWEKYEDLILPNYAEARQLIDAREVFLLGVILNVIHRSANGNFFYETERLGLKEKHQLHTKAIAIQTLAAQEDVRNHLSDRIDSAFRKATITEKQQLLGLLNYYLETVYPKQYIIVGKESKDYVPPEYYSLSRRRDVLYMELSQTDEKQLKNKIAHFTKDIRQIAVPVEGTEMYRMINPFGQGDQ